ncbi:tetratricopeptide repeat protein [Pseudaeromonas sharmana]|uniref:Tetratricopeptide repeat protein n=1 Tax=Pseudaeromonas sharmana TaxID=328412 RepID=A0ABV8CIX4_9GAMM
MKITAMALAVFVMSQGAWAEPYPDLDPKGVLVKQQTAEGAKYSIDQVYLDEMLKALAVHAKAYPVRFDNEADKRKAIQDVLVLDGMLSVINDAPHQDLAMVLRQAQLNSMGHNLDMAGAAEKADQLFQSLLAVAPDNALFNYDYALFLAGSGQGAKAIPLLHKAADAKLYDAYFSLGLVYLSVGNQDAAIENLNTYKRLTGRHAEADKFIAAIESGQVKVNAH